MVRTVYLATLLSALAIQSVAAQETIYSGPQVGEAMPAFKVRGVLEADAGKELDFVTAAGGKPLVLVFVHDVNRQSISMTRVLTGYTVTRKPDGLSTGVVWLDDDATTAENTVKRVKHALTPQAPVGVSLEGREGPGSYGLNRKVMLTVLVGQAGKVTANFALIQPSLQTDLPKILEQIVKLVGGPMPKLEDLPGMPEMARRSDAAAPDVASQLRDLLRPVIRRDASKEDVDKAAEKVEQLAERDSTARSEIGRIANTIVNSDKLSNYGTEHAQQYLMKWAKAYPPPRDEKKRDRP